MHSERNLSATLRTLISGSVAIESAGGFAGSESLSTVIADHRPEIVSECILRLSLAIRRTKCSTVFVDEFDRLSTVRADVLALSAYAEGLPAFRALPEPPDGIVGHRLPCRVAGTVDRAAANTAG